MAEAAGTIEDLSVRITSSHDKAIDTTLRIKRWSAEQRTSRVWRRLGMWWGGALCALVVPPHLPWFTIGFLGGPVAAWLASRQRALVLQQSIPCPDCGTPASLDEQGEQWPLGARCGPCGHVFWVSPTAPAVALQKAQR